MVPLPGNFSFTAPAPPEYRRRRFAALLERFLSHGAPLPDVIKITGTSGKGSVAAMLEAALLRDGTMPGVFTSPHLISPAERIRLGGADISSVALEARLAALAPLFDGLGADFRPSFFEAILLVALDLFREARVRAAILEVAIGGYHDVVSLVPGALSCVTSIGLDHTAELGPTLAAIAADKAGVATPGSTLVLGPAICGQARDAILLDAARRDVRVVAAARSRFAARSLGLAGHEIALTDPPLAFRLPLAGEFQLDNLATALELLRHLPLCHPESIGGIAAARWPARLEYFPGQPAFLLDAAHNALAFHALGEFLAGLADPRPRTLLLGVSEAAKYAEAMAELASLFDEVRLVEGFHRAVHCGPSFPSPAGAQHALPVEERLVVVTGSIFLAGAFRKLLLRERNA